METNKNDGRIRDFFQANKRDIPDNGFSGQVRRRLPTGTFRRRVFVMSLILIGAVYFAIFGFGLPHGISDIASRVAGIQEPPLGLLLNSILATLSVLAVSYTVLEIICSEDRTKSF